MESRLVTGEPIVEGNPRLARAFGRLAESIALVRGHKSVEPADLQAVRRVAEDTVKQERLKVYLCLLPGYRTVLEIVEESGLSKTMTVRILEDMEMLNLVVKIADKTGSPGRPSYLWGLLPLT